MFAFVVLSTGLFSSERSKETVYAGLAKTRGSMELTGGVLATSNATQLTDFTFDLTLAAGGDQVNLNPASTHQPDRHPLQRQRRQEQQPDLHDDGDHW